MEKLSGKTVLVTGASSGIGEATARELGRAGARVIVVARRRDRLERLAAEIPAECLALILDIRDRQAVEESIANLPKEWGAIDILVNNAGLGRGLDRFHKGNPSGWDEMIDTNVKGLLYLSRRVIPGMLDRCCGHVVNIGSLAGREVYPAGNVYCATKHAVAALTDGMRIDLVDTPIRVSLINPGYVKSEAYLVRFYGDAERARQFCPVEVPLNPSDIAEAVVWAVSRPSHVQIAEMLILPTAQAAATIVDRKNI